VKLFNNTIVRIVYRFKFHLDLGISQLSWATGKFPELMALVYLLDKLGYSLGRTGIILVAVGGFTGLFLLGLVWKRIGFYDTERLVNADKDPVTREMLKAARRINNGKQR
jgi:hypothetical protein